MSIEVERITCVNSEFIDELTRIEAEAFGDGGLNRWTFPVIIRHGALYVLKCDNKVCGVADIIKDWSDCSCVFLINFVVRSEERGKGLGKYFLQEIIERLRYESIKSVRLTVAPGNDRAMHLYESLGFTLIAELDGEYGPIDDRLLYELELEVED